MKPTSTAVAFAVATAGIASFSAMDAVMKDLAVSHRHLQRFVLADLCGSVDRGRLLSRAAHEMAARCYHARAPHARPAGVPMAVLFFWGLARVPLAQAIALAFIAPLIALYLAAILLHEKIERRAIFASLLGFAGVIVIFVGQARGGPRA